MPMLKLAWRNLLGAGLRTWLNVLALSFSFVAIILLQGLYNGMNAQAERASVEALYGGGQYWYPSYDPFDALTLVDAHGPVPAALDSLIGLRLATPILIRQATIYSGGRFRSVLLKGIDPDQDILTIPSAFLKGGDETVPALIGTRMAKATGLKPGDALTVQWRDVHGTFDAADLTIAQVMRTIVPEIDNGQIWIPLETLRRITNMPGQATLVVLRPGTRERGPEMGWTARPLTYLLQDIRALARTKSIQASIVYVFLLFVAMLAIFNTQVLSIFRRKREIGTLMALGMTRTQVIELFTLEGALNAVLAALVAAVYGVPLLAYVATKGFGLPQAADTFGFAFGERIFPVYSAALVGGTTALVLVVTTIVSFLPPRRIARLKPTDALRGRMS
jgi:putative ABC transport system permease protein